MVERVDNLNYKRDIFTLQLHILLEIFFIYDRIVLNSLKIQTNLNGDIL